MSFLAAIDRAESYADAGSLLGFLGGRPSGSVPSPFDGLDGTHLAGPQGSHPLALLQAQDLLSGPSGGLVGAVELDGPARVSEGIAGRVRVRAERPIQARSAALRLVGMRIAEEPRSRTERDASGHQRTEWWVEVHGSRIEDLPFGSPPLPSTLAAGQEVDVAFHVPAPRLGPPSAHAGSAMVAWAVEARWDVPMGRDARVAALVPVRQNLDLLRAGVMRLGAGAMSDVWMDGGASLAVDPHPPYDPGTEVALSIAWPGAPGGRGARVELTVDVGAPQRLSVVAARLPIDGSSLAGTSVTVPIPADAPPTLETDGLTVRHRLRVIVDRPLRPDVSVERLIVVA
jgi:hypothetical protein